MQVLKESLRFNPSAPITDEYKINKDCKLGKFEIQKDIGFMMNIFWTHRNPNEWHRPDEFHPQRFDPSHEMFKTPSGKPRKATSFIPFNVGERKCIGYLFAYSIMPSLLTKIIYNFDFEFVDEALKEEHTFPVASTAQNHMPPIEVKIRPWTQAGE